MSSSTERFLGSKGRGLRALGAAALLFLVAACSSSEEEDINYVERPVDDLYNEAMDTLQSGSNQRAAKLFDEVDRQS